MIPKILHDESLHAFVHRMIYIDDVNPALSKFKMLLPKVVGSATIKTVNTAIRGQGCYGFNRLLHDHTSHALIGIFNFPFDISYSQDEYITKSHSGEFDKTLYRYCPERCREDIDKLGFSYWRRGHQLDLAVCGRHNVNLISSCPHCDKRFTSGYRPPFLWPKAYRQDDEAATEFLSGHLLDVIWRGCNGKQIWEVSSERSNSTADIIKAEFYTKLLDYRFYIPTELAIRVLYEKLSLITLSSEMLNWKNIADCETLYRSSLKLSSRRIREAKTDLCREIVGTAIALYSDFDEFIKHIKFYSDGERPIDSLWSTYSSEGFESVHYIQEDYTTGVGLWTCPYPSSESIKPDSRDGITSRHPIIYPCCNFDDPILVNDLLLPRKVRSPMPNILTIGVDFLPSGIIRSGA